MHSADKAPAFILAKAGYDVWLGNSRGNKYSQQHTNYKVMNKKHNIFWQFTWQEMGEYDAPA